MSTTKRVKNPFEFFGIECAHEAKQVVSDCPFCDASQKFYINEDLLLWDCKVCGESGNLLTFIRDFTKVMAQSTHSQNYKELGSDRTIKPNIIKAVGGVYNTLNDSWLFPIKNDKSAVSNVLHYKTYSKKEKRVLRWTPTLDSCLIGLDRNSGKRGNQLWIVEGLWDYIAMTEILKELKLKDDVIGVPGANVFKETWLSYLGGRDINIVYDHDVPHNRKGEIFHPGEEGMDRLVKMIATSGLKVGAVRRISWAGLAEDTKVDIRDLLIEAKGSSDKPQEKTLTNLTSRLIDLDIEEEATKPTVKPINRTSYEEVVKDFEQNLHFPQSVRDTFAIMLAVSVSTTLRGEPLWLHVVAPPSSGKTLFGECISADKRNVVHVGKLTGLFSGAKAKDSDEDLSPIVKFIGKTIFVKDFTSTLVMNQNILNNLFGELRDASDGTANTQYRNQKSVSYEGIRFSMITCVTDAIYQYGTGVLGERFLKVELYDDDYSQDAVILKSLENLEDSILGDEGNDYIEGTNAHKYLKRVTLGFLQHKRAELSDGLVFPKSTADFKDFCLNLSKLGGICRMEIPKKAEQFVCAPRVEQGSRLANQLYKLGCCLSMILDKKEFDGEIRRLLKRVVDGTCRGFTFDVLKVLHENGKLVTRQISDKSQIPDGHVRRILTTLKLAKVLDVDKVNYPGRGKALTAYELADYVKDLMDEFTSVDKPVVKKKSKKRRKKGAKIKN